MDVLQRMRRAVREQRCRISSHAGDRCEFCEGEMEQRRILARFRYKGQTIYVENVPAWVCNKCGEEYFDAPVYKRLEEIARQREQIQRAISFPLAEFDIAIA